MPEQFSKERILASWRIGMQRAQRVVRKKGQPDKPATMYVKLNQARIAGLPFEEPENPGRIKAWNPETQMYDFLPMSDEAFEQIKMIPIRADVFCEFLGIDFDTGMPLEGTPDPRLPEEDDPRQQHFDSP